jgi:hypothetical protein
MQRVLHLQWKLFKVTNGPKMIMESVSKPLFSVILNSNSHSLLSKYNQSFEEQSKREKQSKSSFSKLYWTLFYIPRKWTSNFSYGIIYARFSLSCSTKYSNSINPFSSQLCTTIVSQRLIFVGLSKYVSQSSFRCFLGSLCGRTSCRCDRERNCSYPH